MRQIIALLLGIATLSGCANPGIVKLSPDTYMLSREAHGGIFASASALKAGVISDANSFAESQGKVAVPLSAKEKPMGNGPAQWASFETSSGLSTRTTQKFAERLLSREQM